MMKILRNDLLLYGMIFLKHNLVGIHIVVVVVEVVVEVYIQRLAMNNFVHRLVEGLLVVVEELVADMAVVEGLVVDMVVVVVVGMLVVAGMVEVDIVVQVDIEFAFVVA